MPKKKIYFIGLLANVGASILKLKLEHGFEIRDMSHDEAIRFISALDELPYVEVSRKLLAFQCIDFSKKKLYYTSKSFECDIEMDSQGNMIRFPAPVEEFMKNLINGYLDPVIRLVRLFKEGNICIPLDYCYFFKENKTPRPLYRRSTGLHISHGPEFTLENSEIPNLQTFIQDTRLPFTKSSLQLAFDNFDLSYQTHNINLSFLSLMISLESLFNPKGEHELRYRISRNVAVLLGKDKKDSGKIFSQIRDLYDKRSKIVHAGESKVINIKDLVKLRHYVRESIKEINKIGKNKNGLLDVLNSCGFGERPWTK